MKIRSNLLMLVLCLTVVSLGVAQNVNMGTWKLNEAKSTIPAGVGKNTTVVFSESGSDIKVTTDGVNATGQPTHTEWTGKFDGKPYPLTGDPSADFRAYRSKGEHKLQFANMKGNTTVSNGTVEISKDGKTRTLDANFLAGKKVKAKFVYEKQ